MSPHPARVWAAYLQLTSVHPVTRRRPIDVFRQQIDDAETLGEIVPEPETRRSLTVLRDARVLPGLLCMFVSMWELHDDGYI